MLVRLVFKCSLGFWTTFCRFLGHFSMSLLSGRNDLIVPSSGRYEGKQERHDPQTETDYQRQADQPPTPVIDDAN